MATLKGIWVFNNSIDLSTISYAFNDVDFSCNGKNYVELRLTSLLPNGEDVTQYALDYYYGSLGTDFDRAYIYEIYNVANSYWNDTAYKTVDFGSTEQTVDDTFYTWLTANATQQASEETSGVTVEYNDSVVATIPSGNKATIPIADKKMKTDIVITVPKAEGGTDSAIPIEVSTEAEMTALLTSGEVGGVYKYTGTTGTYENGALYVLEEEATEDELAGTWTFNDYPNSLPEERFNLNFNSNGNDYTYIRQDLVSSDFYAFYYGEDYVFLYDGGFRDEGTHWENEAYKTINITSKLSEVVNGSSLLTWLKANATKQ